MGAALSSAYSSPRHNRNDWFPAGPVASAVTVTEQSLRDHGVGSAIGEVRATGVEEESFKMIYLACLCDPHGPQSPGGPNIVFMALCRHCEETQISN